MLEPEKIVFGIIALSIGIIVLLKNKTLVNMTIESQKGVDKAVGKEQDYNKIGYTLIPKIIILVIGGGFCVFGIIAIISYLLLLL